MALYEQVLYYERQFVGKYFPELTIESPAYQTGKSFLVLSLLFLFI